MFVVGRECVWAVFVALISVLVLSRRHQHTVPTRVSSDVNTLAAWFGLLG